MNNKLKNIFYKWNNIIKCSKCKSTEQKETNIDRLDGWGSIILEYDIVCADCGHYLNHYAYGYLEVPETRIEYVKWLWCQESPVGIDGYVKTIIETLKVIVGK